jgi:radical SAM/Cys-rich protein
MLDTLPYLRETDFPPLARRGVTTAQVNLGYLCNQQCVHCHVNAGPKRKEQMSRATAAQVLEYVVASGVATLDLTGGAPELNPNFRWLVESARAAGIQVIDRCNLSVLLEPGQEDLAEFLARNQAEIVASLPCYLQENVERQRGKGVFDASIAGLRLLNRHGYGDGELRLNLVFNPQGPSLPPPQAALEADYRRVLGESYGIRFNRLFTLCNMPIQRFGSLLLSKGQFNEYLCLLRSAHRAENLDGVMCRDLISIDWRGYVYDCDFNQMLGLPLQLEQASAPHISSLIGRSLSNHPIVVGQHCYACTAGQGSSCGGALAA